MRSYDPVDYENIDKTKFWVVEEEREWELNYNDLENMLDEQEHEPASKSQGDHVDDEVDSEFQLLSDHEIDAYNTPISQDPWFGLVVTCLDLSTTMFSFVIYTLCCCLLC